MFYFFFFEDHKGLLFQGIFNRGVEGKWEGSVCRECVSWALSAHPPPHQILLEGGV